MTGKRFTLTTSANGKIKYINDSKQELSDRHSQIMGFIVEDDHEENVELLINFLNKLDHRINDMEVRFKRKYDYEFDEIVDELD